MTEQNHNRRTLNEAIHKSLRVFPFFMTLFISVLGIYTTYTRISDKADSESIAEQIATLDEMSKNAKAFQDFIQVQKENLKSEQKALEELKKEKKSLEPLVEADKETIEALFKQQEKRQLANTWNERGFGFFIGVLSSLVATFLYALVLKLKKK